MNGYSIRTKIYLSVLSKCQEPFHTNVNVALDAILKTHSTARWSLCSLFYKCEFNINANLMHQDIYLHCFNIKTWLPPLLWEFYENPIHRWELSLRIVKFLHAFPFCQFLFADQLVAFLHALTAKLGIPAMPFAVLPIIHGIDRVFFSHFFSRLTELVNVTQQRNKSFSPFQSGQIPT